jgi:hypothetical protein
VITPDLGRVWATLFDADPETWDVEGIYAAARGTDVSPSIHTHVYLAAPSYRGGHLLAMRRSLDLTANDLVRHEVEVTVATQAGEALVTRMRNRILHDFMMSRANVLFLWDDDVEVVQTDAVRRMLATGRPVLGGAYPYRGRTDRAICAGLLPSDSGVPGEYAVKVDADETLEVAEVPAGFLLVRRSVVATLMRTHPELLYEEDGAREGEPRFALFDTALAPRGSGLRRRYLSEDGTFSHLCRAAEFPPRVFLPPTFRHWGLMPSEGHATEAWGLAPSERAELSR